MRTATRKPAAITVAALVFTILGGVTALTRGAQAAETPWLGVYTQALTTELRDGIDYDGDGVLVSGVVSGSPAARAGLRKGDVITRVEGRGVNAPDELADAVREASVGDRISIRFVRDGQTRMVEARLAARDSGGDDEEAFDIPTPPVPPAPDAPRIRVHRELRDKDSKGSEEDGEAPEDFDVRIKGLEGLKGLEELEGLKGLDLMTPGFRGRLGVRIENLNEGLGSYFKVPGGEGALVVDVVKGSAAEKAGIESGDVITRVGGEAVTGENLAEVVRKADNTVEITLYRNGSRRTVEVELDDTAKAPGAMMWKRMDGDAPGTMTWKSKDGDVQVRRLVREAKDDSALRQEVRDLRREIEDLRRELEGMKRGRN